jgi:hypothetical protein
MMILVIVRNDLDMTLSYYEQGGINDSRVRE